MPDSFNREKVNKLLVRIIDIISRQPVIDDGFAHGRTGLALLYFYYGKYSNEEKWSSTALELVDNILSNLNKEKEGSINTADFFNGFLGFLTVLSNLKQNELLDISYADIKDLDEMVCDWGVAQFQQSNIDFFYGGMGALNYFVNRKQISEDAGYIDILIENLLALFKKENGVFGIINKYYNKVDNRYESEINYSLAHGMASVILCLTALWEGGYRKYEIDKYLINSITYLLKITEEAPFPEPYCFAAAVNIDTRKTVHQPRLGWCYSDMNILHILYLAGKVFSRNDWIERANQVSGTVSNRFDSPDTLVGDPFVCHGSAGLFQYYTLLKDLSGQEIYFQVGQEWLSKTIIFFDETSDDYFNSPAYLQKGHVHSFFYGLTGVALCLLTALDKKFCNWSSIIML
jgi:lantibiotic biosynthesis protein